MKVATSLVPLIRQNFVCERCFHEQICEGTRRRGFVARFNKFTRNASPAVVAICAVCSVAIALGVAFGVPALILAAI